MPSDTTPSRKRKPRPPPTVPDDACGYCKCWIAATIGTRKYGRHGWCAKLALTDPVRYQGWPMVPQTESAPQDCPGRVNIEPPPDLKAVAWWGPGPEGRPCYKEQVEARKTIYAASHPDEPPLEFPHAK